jgi:hypothetical protein
MSKRSCSTCPVRCNARFLPALHSDAGRHTRRRLLFRFSNQIRRELGRSESVTADAENAARDAFLADADADASSVYAPQLNLAWR